MTDILGTPGHEDDVNPMPLRDSTSDLMRIVEGKSGTVAFDMELNLRFDYGRTVPWVTHGEDGGIIAIAGPDRLTLNCAVPLEGRGLSTVGSFQVAAGESQIFILTWSPSHIPQPVQRQVEYALPDTEEFWQSFAAACPKVGRWTEQVKRSLITLKALTYMRWRVAS